MIGGGLGYFDSINHIRRAKCPVEITRAGLGDYTCPPSGLAAYYNAIPGRKSIYLGCNEIFMQRQRVLAAEDAKDAELMPRSRPASGL